MKREYKLAHAIIEIHEAMRDDLEHGVAWINDEVGKAFVLQYPRLYESINKAMKYANNIDAEEMTEEE